GAGHAGAGEVVQIFRDVVVAADRLVGAEDARLHGADQPREVNLAPDVMMGVDNGSHAGITGDDETIDDVRGSATHSAPRWRARPKCARTLLCEPGPRDCSLSPSGRGSGIARAT